MKFSCCLVAVIAILNLTTTHPLLSQDETTSGDLVSSSASAEDLSPDNAEYEPEAKNKSDVKTKALGRYLAGTEINDDTAIGGFGRSDNNPQGITKEIASSTGECYLLAQPTVVTELGREKGMRLVLVNATQDPILLSACDSKLWIVQEAKNDKGEWEPIEQFPQTSCGNSYHRVTLGAGQFWSFPSVRYEGSIKTQLRFRLNRPQNETDLLSNEFEGAINPQQFDAPNQRRTLIGEIAVPIEPIELEPAPLIEDIPLENQR